MVKRRNKKKSKTRTGESKHPRQADVAGQPRSSVSPPAGRNWIALGLGVVGVVLTAYLTANKWFGDQPAFCADGSGCDLVQDSRWSVLLGMPLSLWGLLTYLLLVALLWRQRTKVSIWRMTWWVTVFAFLFSAYLTVVSVVEIEATCVYCLTSFGLISAMLIVTTVQRPRTLPGFSWASYSIGAVGSAFLVIVTIHMHYAGVFDPSAGPEERYLSGLAEHLSDTGAVFYGAYWCPRCQAQKDLFEASVHRVPYQECSPNGRNGPRAIACIDNRIEAFPTWIIGGNRYTGVLKPKELAALSRYAGPEPESS